MRVFLLLSVLALLCTLVVANPPKGGQTLSPSESSSPETKKESPDEERTWILDAFCCIHDSLGALEECDDVDCSALAEDVKSVFKVLEEENAPLDAESHLLGEKKMEWEHIKTRIKTNEELSSSPTLIGLKEMLNRASAKRTAVHNPTSHARAKGVVEYHYENHNAMTKNQKAKWRASMASWEDETCIVFKQEPTGQTKGLKLKIVPDNQGSNCNSWGSQCTAIQIESSRNKHTYSHEFGHALGLYHTNKRANKDTFVTFHSAPCVTRFDTWVCDPANPQFNSVQDAKYNTYCTDSNYKTFIETTLSQAKYGAKVTAPYDHTNAGQITACKRGMCIWGWIAQYERDAGVTDYPAGADKYEWGSIMHYPFDKCISPMKTHARWKKYKYKNPGEHGVLPFDKESVRGMYGCLQIKVKLNRKKKVKTIYVHPEWTLDEALVYIPSKCGMKVKKYNGELHKGGTALTGATLAAAGVVAGDELHLVQKKK